MKAPAHLLILTSLALLPVPNVAGQDREEEMRWSCFSGLENDSIYVTPVWDGTAYPQEVYNAFEQHLLTEYSYKGRVFCSRAIMSSSTLEGLEADNERYHVQLRESGKKVIQTGWTFVPASASLAYQCSGALQFMKGPQRAYTFYLADVQRIPASTFDKLTLAWSEYLAELHPGGYISPAGCNLLPADPVAAEAMTNATVDHWKQFQGEIVRVDWRWRSDQD